MDYKMPTIGEQMKCIKMPTIGEYLPEVLRGDIFREDYEEEEYQENLKETLITMEIQCEYCGNMIKYKYTKDSFIDLIICNKCGAML